MSGFATLPTPDTFAHASDTEDQPHQVGPHGIDDPWVEHGARCDGKPPTGECFLPTDVRTRLISRFQAECSMAANSYGKAIAELKTQQLIAKDDDLPWVVALALDLASSQLSSAFAKAIKNAMPAIREAGAQASKEATSAIHGVSAESLGGMVKSGVGQIASTVKKQTGHALSEHPKPTHDEKKESIGFLDQLRDTCESAFNNFAMTASATATDAEMIVLWYGMKPGNHQPGMYKTALQAKLDRFKASGVPDIGTTGADNGIRQLPAEDVRRVVYVQDASGKKLPWYQVEHHKDMVATKDGWRSNSTTDLDRPVPEEFREAAIARSEQVFGPIQTIRQHGANDPFLEAFGHYVK